MPKKPWLMYFLGYNNYCWQQPNIGELCNGSTTDSDSVCWGSNPYSPANRAGFLTCPFFVPKNLKNPLNKGFARCSWVWLRHLKIVCVGPLLGRFSAPVGSQLGHKNSSLHNSLWDLQKIRLGHFHINRHIFAGFGAMRTFREIVPIRSYTALRRQYCQTQSGQTHHRRCYKWW